MQNENTHILTNNSPVEAHSFSEEIEEYSEILNFYSQEYKQVDYYLQVGEILQVQGWILHLSVVKSQILDLCRIILPVLIEEKVPFKIAENKQACINLLNGSLGIAQIGKILSIYPANDKEALRLSGKLIEITKSFRGPRIPTDILLGNIVYTRYGSFNPILLPDSNGKKEKYIYNKNGELVKDAYSIPFQLPKEIIWPFSDLAEIKVQQKIKNLKNIYRPVSFLKEDARGNVYKGVYLKKWYLTKPCVIKQAKKDMYSDDQGRDLSNRLMWQQELHQKLSGLVPLPKVIDFFKEDEDSYLVMEYIKGDSLYDTIKNINSDSKSWFELEPNKALSILEIVFHITSIINTLHENGIVHRDIVPVNFMIDENNRFYLIDLELAYSIDEMKPYPPFELGTPGFMSPEQQCKSKPTVKEDIYGIGALLLESFTRISPAKFDSVRDALTKGICGLLQNDELGNLIADCLHPVSEKRPGLPEVLETLNSCRDKLKLKPSGKPLKLSIEGSENSRVHKLILSAIKGLTEPPIVVSNDFWYSKMKTASNHSSALHREYIRYVGLCEGISGVLYVLAKSKSIGVNIESCSQHYRKGWDYIFNYYTNQESEYNPGLYTGFAGVAIALNEGLNSDLLNKDMVTLNYLHEMLSFPIHNLSIADGIAGQGIALIRCAKFLSQDMVTSRLKSCIEKILYKQQKDGSWEISNDKNNAEKKLSFGYGNTGIIWFLLEYIRHYPNQEAEISAIKALSWMIKNIKSFTNYKTTDNQKGVIVTLIKAYETLQLENCRKMAEKGLGYYPSYITANDFSQNSGLAGIGEIYLEAAHVFKNDEWQRRANWIANLFFYTFNKSGNDSGFWKMEEANNPTADFMVGNCGIIHFLMHHAAPDKVGYRFLK